MDRRTVMHHRLAITLISDAGDLHHHALTSRRPAPEQMPCGAGVSLVEGEAKQLQCWLCPVPFQTTSEHTAPPLGVGMRHGMRGIGEVGMLRLYIVLLSCAEGGKAPRIVKENMAAVRTEL